MSDTVHVDMVESFRLLSPRSAADLVVLRVTTHEGAVFNFGLDRASFAHTVKVWAFDLQALQGAFDTCAPIPGKPQPDKQAS